MISNPALLRFQIRLAAAKNESNDNKTLNFIVDVKRVRVFRRIRNNDKKTKKKHVFLTNEKEKH
jgi:hypothetical protein